MNAVLEDRIATALAREVRPEVAAYARMLGEEAGALAVLFYGSNLRSGSLEGVLDFYVLLAGPQRERIWPRVSYREWAVGGEVLRAKIATLSLAKFRAAASGATRDTTIWARFVQPSALIWARDEAARRAVEEAVMQAALTASRLAAALGPKRGRADAFWRALFRATYRAEFRIEKPGRENDILAVNAAHFEGLLPLAWEAQGIGFACEKDIFVTDMNQRRRAGVLAWWRSRRRMGKPLNLLRLAKATATFEGAADYAAWKIERHTGVALEVTPFRQRHPLLAAPGALWSLWRARRRSG
ncbi:hypothetical protein [Qipengyuania sp. MTN3-11]|uniref:hypothetical protein n=1 Tax=Qipengyuania sp. MTN3-11 TaxID=3056557 RepID=UPI0036F34131